MFKLAHKNNDGRIPVSEMPDGMVGELVSFPEHPEHNGVLVQRLDYTLYNGVKLDMIISLGMGTGESWEPASTYDNVMVRPLRVGEVVELVSQPETKKSRNKRKQ